jgi:hypothetical protein
MLDFGRAYGPAGVMLVDGIKTCRPVALGSLPPNCRPPLNCNPRLNCRRRPLMPPTGIKDDAAPCGGKIKHQPWARGASD